MIDRRGSDHCQYGSCFNTQPSFPVPVFSSGGTGNLNVLAALSMPNPERCAVDCWRDQERRSCTRERPIFSPQRRPRITCASGHDTGNILWGDRIIFWYIKHLWVTEQNLWATQKTSSGVTQTTSSGVTQTTSSGATQQTSSGVTQTISSGATQPTSSGERRQHPLGQRSQHPLGNAANILWGNAANILWGNADDILWGNAEPSCGGMRENILRVTQRTSWGSAILWGN